MHATWFLLRSRWRRGLGGQIVLALVVALAGTMVLATLAGAKRTETAYDRFVEASKTPEVFLDIGGGGGVVLDEEQIEAVRELPTVRASTVLRALALQPAGTDLYQPTAAPLDDVWGRDLAVGRFVEGRAPQAADEFSLSEQRAELLGLSVGDSLTMASSTPEQIEEAKSGGEFSEPAGPLLDLRLVGIERTPISVASDRDIGSLTMLTPAFVDAHGDEVGSWTELLAVDLRGGEVAVPAFTDGVHGISGLEDLRFEAGGGASNPSKTLAYVAGALRVLAAIAALAGIAAVGLVMLRTIASAGSEDLVLAGLGVERWGRRRLLLLGLAPGALGGLLVAVVGAVAASVMFPFGLGGRSEPDPGVHVEPVALVLGVLVMALVLAGIALAVSYWAVRGESRTARRPRRSWLVGGLAGAGAPFSLIVGSRFVLERDSTRRGMPARTAIAGVALGSAGLIAVLIFTTSQTRLMDTPAAWGRTWDATTAPEYSGPEYLPPEAVVDRSIVHIAMAEIAGHPVETRGFEVVDGQSLIPVAEGRAPGPGEVALGGAILDELDVGIGDTITMKGVSGETDLKVVGQGMFSGLADVPIIDFGAALDQATLARISDREMDNGFDTVIFTFAAGVDRLPIMRSLAEANGYGVTDEEVERIAEGDRPDEFKRLDEVRLLPWLLAGFLGLIAVTGTAALLISAVQRRRHDMAVLRAAGLGGRGVRTIVVAQAAVVSVIGLAFGIPVGLIAGRVVWRLVAEDLGVQVHLEVPTLLVLATVVVVVLVDVMVSLVPALRAARAHPAEDLRTE